MTFRVSSAALLGMLVMSLGACNWLSRTNFFSWCCRPATLGGGCSSVARSAVGVQACNGCWSTHGSSLGSFGGAGPLGGR